MAEDAHNLLRAVTSDGFDTGGRYRRQWSLRASQKGLSNEAAGDETYRIKMVGVTPIASSFPNERPLAKEAGEVLHTERAGVRAAEARIPVEPGITTSRPPAYVDASASRAVLLMIAPDAGSLSAMKSALIEAGHDVNLVGDAEQAFAIVDRTTPDLIMLDLPIAGADSFALCAALKSRTSLADVPILFVAPALGTEDVVRGFRAGATDYISMPVTPGELLARITVHLTASHDARVSRYALNAVGSRLIAADLQGDIVWATAPAYALLEEWLPSLHLNKQRMAEALHKLISNRKKQCGTTTAPVQLGVTACGIEISLIGRTPARDYLLQLNEVAPEKEQDAFVRRLGLTPREAEVLFWVARGKSNRDISDILDIALRTVNKHMEQIFDKLGIENRAAAATLAIRAAERIG